MDTEKMIMPDNPHEVTNRSHGEQQHGQAPLSGSKKTKKANHSRSKQHSEGS
ncbi:small acid-soluble spore protein P [Longirhabdus pacifica]|uniref:small acid-soluble spore protein P n=1 Tax=Longirhabdus pacifica TaxID=2305227 RepID=UPI001F0BE68E|nr:small acid-soluble spore protein P [Longirhabdus pacifica]